MVDKPIIAAILETVSETVAFRRGNFLVLGSLLNGRIQPCTNTF